jgi:hypothetical protein
MDTSVYVLSWPCNAGLDSKRVKIRSVYVLDTDSCTSQNAAGYEEPFNQCKSNVIESVEVRIYWTFQKTENEGNLFKRMLRVLITSPAMQSCPQRQNTVLR